MKKNFKRWLLPVFTLLLIIGGAVMPFAVSAVQDSRLAQATEIREFSPVSLTLQQNADIGNVLQMMRTGYDWFSYDGPTNLSEEEAVAAANECLQTLSMEVMPMPVNTQNEVETSKGLAVLNSDSSVSAILWICRFQNEPVNDYMLIIDDASGKMVELVVRSDSGLITERAIIDNYDYVETYSQIAVTQTGNIYDWVNFCTKYYGIEIVDYTETFSDNNWQGTYWQGTLLYTQDNSEEIYALSLYCWADTIIFN